MPSGIGLPGIAGKAHCGVRVPHERAVGERWIPALRHRRVRRHPRDEPRDQRRAHRSGRRRVRRQRARRGGLHGIRRRGESSGSAAVRDAREVVAAHVVRQRDVRLRGRPDERERLTQSPDFGRAERLHDLRARVGRAAAIEQARRWALARRCRPTVVHHTGPSWPSSYGETRPPGNAKRRLRSINRAAMCGFIPSHTMRPRSS